MTTGYRFGAKTSLAPAARVGAETMGGETGSIGRRDPGFHFVKMQMSSLTAGKSEPGTTRAEPVQADGESGKMQASEIRAEPALDDQSVPPSEAAADSVSETDPRGQGRALTRLNGDEPRRAPTARPDAGFVTQLLACREGVPQMRARRRAGPGQAVRSYRGPAADNPGRLSKRV